MIQIEVEEMEASGSTDIYDGVETRGKAAEQTLKVARPLFSEGLALIESCARDVVNRLESMDDKARPDEFEMQLAVKLDLKAGARIVDVTAGGQLQVVLRWRRA
ncbi:CU044_2847 family protein [Actinomadura geliboluensis]